MAANQKVTKAQNENGLLKHFPIALAQFSQALQIEVQHSSQALAQ